MASDDRNAAAVQADRDRAHGQRTVDDVRVTITMELGSTEATLDELLQYTEDSTIPLDRMAGESIDLLLNGTLVARGEVVTVGEYFGVRVTEVLGQEGEDAP